MRTRPLHCTFVANFTWPAKLAFIALLALPAHASVAAEALILRSVWDGVYTEEQAKAGGKEYQQICQRCHGTDTRAGEEVALWGDEFWKSWREDTVENLYHYVSAEDRKNKRAFPQKPAWQRAAGGIHHPPLHHPLEP